MRGSAILAIDGQPPRAFAVGERIGPIQSLFAVRADGVVIEENGRQILLPAPPRPTVSLLTDGPARAGGLDPGFASPADAGAARIARPLGAGTGRWTRRGAGAAGCGARPGHRPGRTFGADPGSGHRADRPFGDDPASSHHPLGHEPGCRRRVCLAGAGRRREHPGARRNRTGQPRASGSQRLKRAATGALLRP